VQRLSRWLLLCADRSDADIMLLTHEYLADMLGSNRSTVSMAAEHLQREGFIKYSQGKLVILERANLELSACECYRVVKNHLDSYLEVTQN
jgi:Mn-dependent DtxR family transcriptional regulator